MNFPSVSYAEHYEWLVRQYQYAALMFKRGQELQGGYPEELLNKYPQVSPSTLLLQASIGCTKQRELASSSSKSQQVPQVSLDSVEDGYYIGQKIMKTTKGRREMTEREYLGWLQARAEDWVGGYDRTIELLEENLDEQKKLHQKSVGTICYMYMLLVVECEEAGRLGEAKKWLLKTLEVYRRIGWDYLLCSALQKLRYLSESQKSNAHHLLYSLELSFLSSHSNEVSDLLQLMLFNSNNPLKYQLYNQQSRRSWMEVDTGCDAHFYFAQGVVTVISWSGNSKSSEFSDAVQISGVLSSLWFMFARMAVEHIMLL
eukprot:TRINITY_DN3825_c1_g1_i1.p1 TRINITY_DN3825_c1_g1~~TRINITY_DN3825_c1_g1_i1.p1  ORF type:complete len:315 (-),score=28.14 TRINITY_DN3825_c1_g1_i1:42-986(-)